MSRSLPLTLSLATNVALLAIAVVLLKREQPQTPAADEVAPHSAAVPTPTAATDVAPSTSVNRASGRGLTSETMGRLEGAGISRNVLVDIKRLDFRRRWNRR